MAVSVIAFPSALAFFTLGVPGTAAVCTDPPLDGSGIVSDCVRLMDGIFCADSLIWNPTTVSWDITRSPGITEATVGAMSGQYDTVQDAFDAGCRFLRVVDSNVSETFTFPAAGAYMLYIDPGVRFTVDPGGTPISMGGATLAIKGSSNRTSTFIYNLDDGAGALFSQLSSANTIYVMDCQIINSTTPPVVPSTFVTNNAFLAPVRMRDVIVILPDSRNGFMGDGTQGSIDLEMHQCTIAGGGTSCTTAIDADPSSRVFLSQIILDRSFDITAPSLDLLGFGNKIEGLDDQTTGGSNIRITTGSLSNISSSSTVATPPPSVTVVGNATIGAGVSISDAEINVLTLGTGGGIQVTELFMEQVSCGSWVNLATLGACEFSNIRVATGALSFIASSSFLFSTNLVLFGAGLDLTGVTDSFFANTSAGGGALTLTGTSLRNTMTGGDFSSVTLTGAFPTAQENILSNFQVSTSVTVGPAPAFHNHLSNFQIGTTFSVEGGALPFSTSSNTFTNFRVSGIATVGSVGLVRNNKFQGLECAATSSLAGQANEYDNISSIALDLGGSGNLLTNMRGTLTVSGSVCTVDGVSDSGAGVFTVTGASNQITNVALLAQFDVAGPAPGVAILGNENNITNVFVSAPATVVVNTFAVPGDNNLLENINSHALAFLIIGTNNRLNSCRVVDSPGALGGTTILGNNHYNNCHFFKDVSYTASNPNVALGAGGGMVTQASMIGCRVGPDSSSGNVVAGPPPAVGSFGGIDLTLIDYSVVPISISFVLQNNQMSGRIIAPWFPSLAFGNPGSTYNNGVVPVVYGATPPASGPVGPEGNNSYF